MYIVTKKFGMTILDKDGKIERDRIFYHSALVLVNDDGTAMFSDHPLIYQVDEMLDYRLTLSHVDDDGRKLIVDILDFVKRDEPRRSFDFENELMRKASSIYIHAKRLKKMIYRNDDEAKIEAAILCSKAARLDLIVNGYKENDDDEKPNDQ